MKVSRFDFSKGINLIADKAVAGPGWVSVADNVDLRAGIPRPFMGPQKVKAVADDVTRIFSYRGKWHTSENWRDYVAEHLDNIDRIYWTEYGGAPKMWISSAPYLLQNALEHGVTVDLGQDPPDSIPMVSTGRSTSPNITVTETSGGYPNSTTRSYRVAWENEWGILPPSGVVLGKTSAASKGFIVSWTNTRTDIKKIHIFAGYGSDEQLLVTLGAAAETYTDGGEVTTVNTAASNFDQGASLLGSLAMSTWAGSKPADQNVGISTPYASEYIKTSNYTYFYSFVRDVNGVQDESGPSDPSVESVSQMSRIITFDYMNEGTMDFLETSDKTFTLNTTPADGGCSLSEVAITATEYAPNLNTTKFTVAAHTMMSPTKVRLNGFSDASVDGVLFDAIADYTSDPTAFWVSGIQLDGVTGTYREAKAAITCSYNPVNEQPPVYLDPTGTADVTWIPVYIDLATISSADAVTGLHRVVARPNERTVSSTLHYIDLYVDMVIDGGATINAVRLPVFPNLPPKYRNLYRCGDVGGWFLVDQVPIYETTYEDTKPFSALGLTPSCLYEDNGTQVIFSKPPGNMRSLESHYGMLAAIDGSRVRWTPIGKPNAWPENFYFDFAYAPVRIASFAQALVVLCPDAIYRIDGNRPTALTVSKTMAEDGCIAANSVQKTSAGLVYMSKRGVMLFDGNRAQCLTDMRIPPINLIAPSAYPVKMTTFMRPTQTSINYSQGMAEESLWMTPIDSEQTGFGYIQFGYDEFGY